VDCTREGRLGAECFGIANINEVLSFESREKAREIKGNIKEGISHHFAIESAVIFRAYSLYTKRKG